MCDLDGCGNHDDLPPIDISDAARRAFLIGAASLPLATVLYDPALAQAAAGRLRDVRIPYGGDQAIAGSLALPVGGKGPAILLIHEWWGLNDQIKAVAAELAGLGYVALAVNLFGKPAATTPDAAQKLVADVDAERATAALAAAVSWLKRHERATGTVGVVGWCFGGGWSLNTALAAPVDAAVVYYGNVRKTPEQLKTLNAPVLGHFGTLDKNINAEMVGGFEKAAAAAGKSQLVTVHWYEADHAFANPTGARYDAEDAALAWRRTTDFFKSHLG
jgi:carboxymethylenebutenolidase